MERYKKKKKNRLDRLLNLEIICFIKSLLKAGIIIHSLHAFMFIQDLFRAETVSRLNESDTILIINSSLKSFFKKTTKNSSASSFTNVNICWFPS